MYASRALLTLCLSSFCTLPLAAQAPAGDEPISTQRTLRAAPAAGELRMDGRLDEPGWEAAQAADGFVQRQPDPGTPATQRTEARILYDADAVYVAMRMYDDRPDSIAAPLARRDAGGIYSDWAYVMLDSYDDNRSAFIFAVNPRGVQKDYTVFNDSQEDISWDAVWEVGTRVDSLGWTAEFRIPLTQLRFDPSADRWGLNLQRRVGRTDEWSFWSTWPPNAPGYVSHFGVLEGLDGLRSVQRLEIQPYVSSRLTRAPGSSDDPFYDPTDVDASAGADLQVGLTSGLTLTAAINPDFGQVEVDPAQVNLTAFETFFAEKRPFFVEGADVFRFGQVRSNINVYNKEFFYSRRIGRTPQRLIGGPEVQFVDAPEQTPILGAAKITGRVGSWTVGVMDAVTARAEATFLDTDGEIHTSPVEPRTNYLTGRVRRDLREGRSVFGSMVTATNRAMGDGGEFDGLLRSDAYFGGIDFEHSWADRAWTVSGYASGSLLEGSPAAIERAQLAPARYYQRPDAEHVELDPDRTSLGGHMGAVALSHSGAWDLSLFYEEASPGFEINDLGFQGRTDFRSLAGFAGVRKPDPVGIFRNRSAYVFGAQGRNFAGDRILTFGGVGANAMFTNLWNIGMEGNVQPSVYDDRLTRGGPLARSPASWSIGTWLGTDARRKVSLQGSVNLDGDEAGGYSRSFGVSADWRPSPALRLRLGPNVSSSRSTRQYVAAVGDALATETFGRRYVFAEIDRTTVSMSTRLDWTFTPRLSLELYAQPFIAAGDYGEFKEFAAPGTAEFDTYGEDRGTIVEAERPSGATFYRIDPDADGAAPEFELADPDFNIRSLRGNAVLRWEYRPGSTLFFVWQQKRSGFEPMGDFRFRRDADEIFRARATNVFLIKASYYFGL